MKKRFIFFALVLIFTISIFTQLEPQAIAVNTQHTIAISAGDGFSMAIQSDGSLWSWGTNSDGQLGDGTSGIYPYNRRATPVRIMNNVTAVSAGWSHAAAIQSDGSLWAWGGNSRGQLGDGTSGTYPDRRTTPIRIMSNVTAVSAGDDYTMAIRSDGSLWAWGANWNGRLGDGTNDNRITPIKIMDNVAAVSASSGYTMAIQSDGSLWSWGANWSGQLGDGSTEQRSTPAKIMDNVASVSTSFSHAMAIRNDGSLWVWGSNSHGELGLGIGGAESYYSYTPMKVMDDVIGISAGFCYSMVIRKDSSLWAWGLNGEGQLGIGSVDYINYTPTKVMDNVVSVSTGGTIVEGHYVAHTMAIRSDGSLWTWGSNETGQLGYEFGYGLEYESIIALRHAPVRVTIPDTIAPSEQGPFTMGVDNYRFSNTNSSFGYNRNYAIPLERYLEIFTPSSARLLYYINAPWAGSCYGFAASAYAFEVNRLRHSDYQSGVSRTYDFSIPGSPNSAVTRLIELYHIGQNLPNLWSTLRSSQHMDNLSALVAAANNEDGLIVGLWGSSGGHAVLVYGVERISNTRYSLSIYDNNQPDNTNLRIEVDLAMSGSSAWRFNSADRESYNTRISDHISFVDGELIHNEIQRAKVNRSDGVINGMQIIVPVNAEIVDMRGINVENIDGAHRFIPFGILPLNPDGSDPTPQRTTEMWILPADDYIVMLDNAESTTVSVLDDDRAFTINLSPSDDSITIEIGDVVEIEGTVHGNITEYHDDGTELLIPITATSSVDLEPGNMEEASFSDVASGTWFNSAITSMATVGVVSGVGNNRFNPQGQLSVAELVTMLMRTQYGRLSGGSPWFANYIERAQLDGILLASDNLDPRAGVTRAQAALIITRYIECYNPQWVRERVERTPTDMSDVPDDYQSAVEKAYAWGILSGDNNNRFNPQSTLTRAQAAQILYNYFRIVD